jgi:hypothetical protein
VGQYTGVTRFKDYIYAVQLEANVSLGKEFVFQFKLPYQGTKGPMGSMHGFSDISVSLSRNLIRKNKWQLNATIGGKIRSNAADKDIDGRILPMYYQPSLGTYDFVMGASFITRKWLIATGWQHAFNQNDNGFFWGPWKEVGLFEEAKLYPASINLKRGEDVMFRVERNFRFSKFNLALGYLHIHRLNEDTREHPVTGEREKVFDDEGTTKGVASTLLLTGGYNFNTKLSLKMVVGRRLVKRHFNSDGLSREWVVSPALNYNF